LQAAIDHWAHGHCPLTGQDLIDASHKTGVQVDLMLAQMVQECSAGNCSPNSRPFVTKNLWDVGNVDNGNNHQMADFHTGLNAYCHLMATSYGTTAEQVCGRGFVNQHNSGHYASDPTYSAKIWSLVLAIRALLQ